MDNQISQNQIVYFTVEQTDNINHCSNQNSSSNSNDNNLRQLNFSRNPSEQDHEQEMDYEEEIDQYQLIVPTLNSQSSQFSEPPALLYSYSGISNASSSTPEFTLHSSRISQQVLPHFVFVKADKLFSSLQKLVSEVKQALSLEQDITLYLLHKYQWNKQKLYENYVNFSKIYTQKNNFLRQNKNKILTQQIIGLCHICSQDKKLTRNMLCSHSYCDGCWRAYIKQGLNQNKVFFPCMDKCQVSSVLLHYFVDKKFPQFSELYRKIVCINYAAINKSISYCPSQKVQCDVFCQRSESQYDVSVECLCGEFYCFFCRKQPHHPATCDDVTKWQKLLNDQSSNHSWIQKNTKVCPNCKNSVQKYIGCSKIKCVCGAEFCYECNSKWDEKHKSNKGQCLQLSRKSSLQERTTTNDFIKLHQKSNAINRTLNKNINTLKLVFQCLKQQWIQNRFHGIRKEVVDAWMALKWGSIVSFIYKKLQVESFVQQQFIQSIIRLMQSVQKLNIQNFNSLLCPKDMLSIGDQVCRHRQALKKNKDLWFEAWRSC